MWNQIPPTIKSFTFYRYKKECRQILINKYDYKKYIYIYILNHFTLSVCLTPGQLLSVQTKLGVYFICKCILYIFL